MCDLINKDTYESLRVVNEFLYPLKHLLHQFITLAEGNTHCTFTYKASYTSENHSEKEAVTVDLNQLSICIPGSVQCDTCGGPGKQ